MTRITDFRAARWLFFDVGNTLVSEDAATEDRIRQLMRCFERRGRRFSAAEIRGALQKASTGFAPRLLTAALAKLCEDPQLCRVIAGGTRYPKELERPHDDAPEVLRRLSAHYRIGVIANQSLGTEQRLTDWGMMPFVSLCFASAELGIEKPDQSIFRLALAHAECMPAEAVMIGDRLDNDIRPARLQGWRTVRILQGLARFQSPRDAFDEPDSTVLSLNELLPMFLT
jgi:FMN phosphatase YigB (HAD superfamily)